MSDILGHDIGIWQGNSPSLFECVIMMLSKSTKVISLRITALRGTLRSRHFTPNPVTPKDSSSAQFGSSCNNKLRLRLSTLHIIL